MTAIDPRGIFDRLGNLSGRETASSDRQVLEQAKGALMLRYGIGSHEALAVLVRWSQAASADVRTVARTLVFDVCQGDKARGLDHPALADWLDAQLELPVPE
jgi:hypothetical protein